MLRLLLCVSLAALCTAHVRLTFPIARNYDLDFLDNARTLGACGMMSNEGSPVTTFEPGHRFNVTWHLAYAHQGGFQLQLLDAYTDDVVYQLTPLDPAESDPGKRYFGTDATATSFEVEIPPNASGHYTLRLLRQAKEWSAGGSVYFFKSCANIDVVSGMTCNTNNDCSGNGNCRNGVCECNRLAQGAFCQYVDDCGNVDDCNDNGVCVEISRTSFPRRQCFCDSDHYGPHCEFENPSDFTMDVTMADYRTLRLNGDSGDYDFHFRILEDKEEIEVVMDIYGSTWMALGWRPADATRSCQNWPVNYRTGGVEGSTQPGGNPHPEGTAEPHPEGTAEPHAGAEPASRRRRKRAISDDVVDAVLPKNFDDGWYCSGEGGESGGDSNPDTDPEGTPEGQPHPEGEPEGTAHPEGEPESTAEPHPEGEPHPEVEPTPEGSAEPNPEGEPEGTTHPEGEPEGTPYPEGEPEGTAHPEGEPESTAEPHPEGEPHPEVEPTPEGSAEPNPEGEPDPEGPPKPSGPRPSHEMDCQDIVVGKVMNGYSHVADYYTRDRATPRLDSFWGGSDDITAAGGMQYGERTRLVFRKKLMKSGKSDHSIYKDKPMFVIWAHGQEYCKYYHWPNSGVEAMTAQDSFFYPRFELKYHGTSSNNRGFFDGLVMWSSEPPTSGQCGGEFTLPAGCAGTNCDYKLTYTYDEEMSEVTFNIESKIPGDYWGGVAFSSSGAMVGSDAVLSWPNSNGVYEVKDMYLGGKSPAQVVEDTMQDLTNTMATYENGVLTMQFTRKQDTGDAGQDQILDENNCVTLLLPRAGGPVSNQMPGYHSSGTPVLSPQQVCIQSCAALEMPSPTPPETGDGSGGSGSTITASLVVALFATIMAIINMH